ncbi:MAG: SigE family RNA polymerase sigma factor [Propionibacteriaceae bacterium]|jgi:RNA polymerase sigma-70 factor (sigma-E family)|nr:SigE family RNA polymerase sigma factor [Propionibacteriaceae bacterium]
MAGQEETFDSFEAFMAASSPGLLRFAYLITHNAEDAADAVQDALLGLLPKWERVISAGNPLAYVRRSIVNASHMRYRRFGRETPSQTLPETAGSDAYQAVEDVELAEKAFALMNKKQRVAVTLRFYEDLSFAEIGEVLGCSEATARSIVHRALGAVRERM